MRPHYFDLFFGEIAFLDRNVEWRICQRLEPAQSDLVQLLGVGGRTEANGEDERRANDMFDHDGICMLGVKTEFSATEIAKTSAGLPVHARLLILYSGYLTFPVCVRMGVLAIAETSVQAFNLILLYRKTI